MAKTWRRLPAKARQQLSDERLITSVSNTSNTETGFPVFGTFQYWQIPAKFYRYLERIKWALLTKITTF
jgi:hypothetical protein